MGQSLSVNYTHIIFSTKHRAPLIRKEIEDSLFAYLAKVANENGCAAIQVGGHRDHVHLLCRMSKKIALMDLLKALKTNSSRWMKTNGKTYEGFYWQDGYGSFSVRPADIHIVKRYIQNQSAHHSKKQFKEEYLEILEESSAEFDEKYIWD